jgi:hypothetical protein
LLKRPIVVLLFLNIGFVLLLCGCYSAMHPAQVTDGLNMTLALYPLHHEFAFNAGVWETNIMRLDIVSSVALRYGQAPSEVGEWGAHIGIVVDISASDTWGSVRGDLFLQFPKNPYIDFGLGLEFFPIPYAVISKNIGTRFTVYSQVRWTSDTYQKNWVVPTVGSRFDISKHFAVFTEVSMLIHKHMPKLGWSWSTKQRRHVAPVIGIGLVVH